jgi:hypothetical protein
MHCTVIGLSSAKVRAVPPAVMTKIGPTARAGRYVAELVAVSEDIQLVVGCVGVLYEQPVAVLALRSDELDVLIEVYLHTSPVLVSEVDEDE